MHAQNSPRCIRFALALTLPGAVFAQSTPDASTVNTQQSAYRSSIAQETVRKQTDKIQEEINQLVAEAKLNGMDNAGLIALVKASSRLKTLSQEDMQKVIVALQSASMNTEDAGRQKSLVSAYQKQKDVSLQLKTLAADLAAQESQKALPAKLQSLIARQSANIRQTTTFASVAPAQLAGPQKSTHDVVSSEQASIGGEIDLLFKVLAAAPEKAATPDAPATPDTAKLVLEAMNNSSLKVTSDAAIKFTAEGPFPDAVVKETSIREYLTNLLRIARSKVDAVAQLEEAKSQLNQLITDQKDLAAAAEQAKLDGATLAERQAKINDRTSVAQAQLKPLNQAAAAQVTEAQKEMEKSAAALDKAKTPADPTQPKPDSEAQKDKDKTASADKSPTDKAKEPADKTKDAADKAKDPSDTAAQQKAVVDSLEKAAAMLDKQIADAQKQQDMNPADKLAQLEKLQEDIKQAQQNPTTTPTDLQKLQQDALAPSPEAANKIADAADKLQQPQPDKAAASQALAQAADTVKKQADDLKKAADDYKALSEASDQLAKAQEQAKAADDAIKNNTSTNQTEAARNLAQAQANVDQAKQNAQQKGLPQDSQQAMQQASDALKEATNQAVQAQGAKAQAQGQKAQAAMQQAQKGLAQAMAQVQQQAQGQQQPGQKQQQQSSQAMNNQAPDQGTSQLLKGFGGTGIAQVMGGLTPKDRDAISQLQAEKSPAEYAPQVQQYLKNLADSSQSR